MVKNLCRVRMAGIKHSVTDEEALEVANLAHGFVGADIALLVREAAFRAYRRCIMEKMTDMTKVWVPPPPSSPILPLSGRGGSFPGIP
jgi:SpoVK/Ycf46/Vps4 family AAA+-type ATPase